MIRALLPMAIGLALAPAVAAQTVRPSFECRRATAPDERTICGDDRLAQMDRAEAAAMAKVPKALQNDARASAIDQLKARQACGTGKLCILDNQATLIGTLDDDGAHSGVPSWVGAYRLELIEGGAAPMVPGLLKAVGSCTRTTLTQIGTRFSETLHPPNGGQDEGVHVTYANDGFQVSYSYDAAVGASKVGDEVVLCLVSVPQGCPPGDDRGKMYSATNVRTKGSWILPDAQHICGGA